MEKIIRKLENAREVKVTICANQIVKRLLLMAVAAILLTYFLELRYFSDDAARTWTFIADRPKVFFYNSLLMLFIVMFFTGLARKPFLGIGVTLAVVMVVAYINASKFSLRGAPLLPEDLQLATEAASLSKFVDVWGIVRLVLAIILTIIASVLADKLTEKYLQDTNLPEDIWWRKHQVGSRVFLVVVAIFGFMNATDFARNHNGKRYEDIPWLESKFVAWNQVRNYDNNGFILGFMYNWGKFTLEEPEGYSEEKITEIREEYSAKAEKDKSKSLAEADYNIVVVLDESFYDPELIREYYPYNGGEVLPNLRKITAKYPSGNMYTVDYGGGTANVEFEVLTGLSNYWANTVPYTDILPKIGEIPSMASYLKGLGYGTVAIHPFNGAMYKRSIALKNEGFDTFITELEMDFREHDGNSEYINDRSAYKQAIHELEEREQKQMVLLITMQNHAPYDAGNYEEHEFSVEIEDGGKKNEIETYLQSLRNSDKYLGEFISALDKLDEPTVVLFFGDHSAGVFPEVVESEDKVVKDLIYQTPYFIYTNFELGDGVVMGGEEMKVTGSFSANGVAGGTVGGASKLPSTTPNCLSNTLFNYLGVKKPALDYLLDEVCTEEPKLATNYLGEGGAKETEAIEKYKLVNYDILGGKKYWVK